MPRSLPPLFAVFLVCAVGTASGQEEDEEAGAFNVLETVRDADGHVGVTAAVVDSEAYGGVRLMRYGDCLLGAELTVEGYEGESLFTAFAIMGRGLCKVASKQRKARGGATPPSVLVLGLGAGTAPKHYLQHCPAGVGARVTSVENSTTVARFAQAHFGYATKLPVVLGDAREVVFDDAQASLHDVVLQDLYMGWNPLHMLSLDVFERLKAAWMTPGTSVLIVNFVGYSPKPHDMREAVDDGESLPLFSEAVAVTLRKVFAEVRCYRDGPLSDEMLAEPSNIICFCSDDPLLIDFGAPARSESVRPFSSLTFDWHHENFRHWRVLDRTHSTAPVLDRRDPSSLEPFQASLARTSAFMKQQVRGFLPDDLWT